MRNNPNNMARKILSTIEQVDLTPPPVVDPVGTLKDDLAFLSKVKKNKENSIAESKTNHEALLKEEKECQKRLTLVAGEVEKKNKELSDVIVRGESLGKTERDVFLRIESLKKEEDTATESLEKSKAELRTLVIDRGEVRELEIKKSNLLAEIKEKEVYLASISSEIERLKGIVDEFNALKPEVERLKKEIEGLNEMKTTLIKLEKELREKKDWIHRQVDLALIEQTEIENKLKAGRSVLKQQENDIASRNDKIKNLDDAIIEKEKTVSIMDAVIEFRKNKKFVEGVKSQL